MLLHELFDIEEDIYFVEESYLAQRTIERTLQYLNGILDVSEEQHMQLLRAREGDHTLGLLIFNPADEEVSVDFWSVFTGSLALAPLKKEFEAIANSLLISNIPEKDVEISSEKWRDAVNEYYSLMLVNRNLCPVCTFKPESYESVFSEKRVMKLTKLLDLLQKKGFYFGARLLEVCSGNGMSTLALRRLGLDPLVVEVNKCAVCQGLEQGVLDPQKVIVMDATSIFRYFDPETFDAVMGFMLGLIYEFNKELWTGIIRESVLVANKGALLLFTVNSKPEIEILTEALHRAGVEGEIIDNTDSEGIYDQWIFVGRKQRT
jgi:hypothetical protein